MDEFSYYRQPSLACSYHATGNTLPYAFQVARSNTRTRLVGVLNGLTGKVTYLQRSKIGILALQEFYKQVRAEYPDAKTIYVVQDNWPVHKLPEVFQAMQKHALTPLFLPTYASWLNPIEKLWRWLKQDILHLHALANNLETLRSQVRDFLDGFASGSDTLLRSVGLLD
jgi:transposase